MTEDAEGVKTDPCAECGAAGDWTEVEVDDMAGQIEWRERPVDGLFTAEDIAAIAANAARARGEAV